MVFAICSKFAIFAKLAIFAQIAIIAEIATLQGATFGMQFESPLHAFLEISATSRPKIIQIFSKTLRSKACYLGVAQIE